MAAKTRRKSRKSPKACKPCKPCKPCKSPKKKTSKKRKTNPWLLHIKKVKAENKHLAFKDVLKLAAKNYKKN